MHNLSPEKAKLKVCDQVHKFKTHIEATTLLSKYEVSQAVSKTICFICKWELSGMCVTIKYMKEQ